MTPSHDWLMGWSMIRFTTLITIISSSATLYCTCQNATTQPNMVTTQSQKSSVGWRRIFSSFLVCQVKNTHLDWINLEMVDPKKPLAGKPVFMKWAMIGGIFKPCSDKPIRAIEARFTVELPDI